MVHEYTAVLKMHGYIIPIVVHSSHFTTSCQTYHRTQMALPITEGPPMMGVVVKERFIKRGCL